MGCQGTTWGGCPWQLSGCATWQTLFRPTVVQQTVPVPVQMADDAVGAAERCATASLPLSRTLIFRCSPPTVAMINMSTVLGAEPVEQTAQTARSTSAIRLTFFLSPGFWHEFPHPHIGHSSRLRVGAKGEREARPGEHGDGGECLQIKKLDSQSDAAIVLY